MKALPRLALGLTALALLLATAHRIPAGESPSRPGATDDGKAATSSVATPKPFEQSMGIYLQGRKVGTTRLVLSPVSPATPLHAEGLRHRFVETLSMQGIQSETEGWLHEDFSLGRFRFEFQGLSMGGGNLSCSGHIEGASPQPATLKVAVESEGVVHRREFALEEPCYLSSASHLPALLRPLRPGAESSWMVFDPMTQSLGPMSFRVEERAKRTALGRTYDAFKVVMTFQGIEQTSWMTAGGLRLRDEALEEMMVAEIEPPEEASSASLPADSENALNTFMLDLIDDLKVRSEGRIPRPRRCRRLVLELSGISPGDVVVDDYWQRLLKPNREEAAPGDPFQVEIGFRAERSPRQETLEPYLEAGFLVQADAPAIVEQATRIVQGLKGDRDQARRLGQWVYDHLDRSSLRLTIPSAVEVLSSRKGDCNEHATLFAALARAAGLPTKVAVGVLYARGAFFYHAWNEVYLEEGGWTPLDTTLNQLPADATHLKLAEGELDQQVAVLKAVGKLEIRVIEAVGQK